MLSEQEEPRFLYARFIVTLFRMMQTVRIHKNNNQLIKQCTTHFVEAEKRILYDDKLSLQISPDRLYIQGEKLHERKGNILAIKDFTEFLKQQGHYQGHFSSSHQESAPPATRLVRTHYV